MDASGAPPPHQLAVLYRADLDALRLGASCGRAIESQREHVSPCQPLQLRAELSAGALAGAEAAERLRCGETRRSPCDTTQHSGTACAESRRQLERRPFEGLLSGEARGPRISRV